MDVLTDVLGVLHLTSRVYCRSELRAPWGLAMPPARHLAFHVIDQGRAWLRRDGAAEPVALKAGDLVVLPRGSGHQLVDHPDTLRQSLISLQASPGCPRLQLGGDGQATTLVCGYFRLLEEGRLGGSPAGTAAPRAHPYRGRGGMQGAVARGHSEVPCGRGGFRAAWHRRGRAAPHRRALCTGVAGLARAGGDGARLARGAAQPADRSRPRPATRLARAELDGRGPRRRGQPVALVLRGALHCARGGAAPDLSDAVAYAPSGEPAARECAARRGCRARRVRVRGGVQRRVQARAREAARAVPALAVNFLLKR